jgi:uncharacterized membrane protein YqaE (UPF0057 family)
MKLFTKVNAIGLVLASFVIASCSTSNNVVNRGLLSKRKYTKGYHYNAPSILKSDKTETAANEVKTKTAPAILRTESVIPIETNVVAIETAVKEAVIVNEVVIAKETKAVTIENNSIVAPTTVKQKVASQKTSIAQKIVTKKLNKTVAQSSQKGDQAILYIILCILIPFVAVGLATDWDLTKTLIALLLSILFWIPGIIYAFWVCSKEGKF